MGRFAGRRKEGARRLVYVLLETVQYRRCCGRGGKFLIWFELWVWIGQWGVLARRIREGQGKVSGEIHLQMDLFSCKPRAVSMLLVWKEDAVLSVSLGSMWCSDITTAG
jgi:hypothetical protein